MKIGLYEPHPRICGPSLCTRYLRDGFRQLGHQADIITLTKSGKASTLWGGSTYQYGYQWSGYAPDVAGRFDDAKAVFGRYDLLYLGDTKCATLDNHVDITKDPVPLYVKAMQQNRTPWISAMFGPQYDVKRAPYLPLMLQTPGFCGRLITGSLDWVNTRFPGVEFFGYPWFPCPVVPAKAVSVWPPPKVVGFAGRVVENKGPQTLLWLAANNALPVGWSAEIWGSSSVAQGPAFGHVMYQYLTDHGFTGTKFVKTGIVEGIQRPHPFHLERDYDVVEYHGSYANAADVFPRFGTYVNFTDRNFSNGAEFSVLEALSHGNICILPTHMLRDAADFATFELTTFDSPPQLRFGNREKGEKTEFRNAEEKRPMLDELTGLVELAAALPETVRRDWIAHNRMIIATKHSPKRFAQYVLDVFHASADPLEVTDASVPEVQGVGE